ncbi:MAG: CHASE domain-containing protein [Candidatus Saccharimonadales bacterium]
MSAKRTTKKPRKQSAFGRLKLGVAEIIVPLAVFATAGAISYDVYRQSSQVAVQSFNDRAHGSANRATEVLNNYTNLLYAAKAFQVSSDTVTQADWRNYFAAQDTFRRYPGLSSVSYVELVSDSELDAFEQRMRTPDFFGPSFRLKVERNSKDHGFISSYAAQNDIGAVIGSDLLANPDRRELYERAVRAGNAVASSSLQLATGHRGFFVLLPNSVNGVTKSYILLSFRIEEMMPAVLAGSDEGMIYRVTDVTDGQKEPVWSSVKQWPRVANVHNKQLRIGDRSWLLEVADAEPRSDNSYVAPVIILSAGVILAMALLRTAVREAREFKRGR